ncbi:MAG TPA: hypothetical protein VHR17_08685 [Thermoanaerobaculia bacterium]|nr:hypothetical protein [Thermoanaerobaculia bacterium]
MRAATPSLRPEVTPLGAGQQAVGRRTIEQTPSAMDDAIATAGEGTEAPLTDRIARIALPLACAVSWLVIAAFQREPSVAAEARYLGLVTAALLLAALQAAPRIDTLLGTSIVLLGAIPWALPGTADRGVAVGVLLAAILAIAVLTESARTRGAVGLARAAIAWPPSRIVALVMGAQILARSGELLAPATRDVVSVVLWAALAAVAILLLAEQRGLPTAALAGASAFVLGPGFTMTTAMALAAPALATLIADDRRALRLADPRLGRRGLRVACAGALAAPLLVDFEHGAFLVLGAIAFAAPRWARWTAGLAALTAFFAPGADRLAGLEGPAWLLVLVPIVVSEIGIEAGAWRFGAARVATRFAALCLGLAIAAQLPDRSALAVPAVMLAATLGGARPLAAAAQAAWSSVLAIAVAILAAYPWLRTDALADATALLGLGAGWRAALTTLALLTVAATVAILLARSRRPAASPEQLAPLALAVLLVPLALLAHRPVEASPIARQPIDLDERSPAWSARLDAPARVATLVVDSSLSHAATIAPGTAIAEVRLVTTAGEITLPVRTGVDTGEWAARRSDVAAIPGFTAPAPYVHWVDAGRGFFGQRYRARLRLDQPAIATAVEVRLAPGISPDVVLTLFHLELVR